MLLCALDREVGQALSAQFERQEVAKTYHAVVRGWPPESGEIDHALVRRYDDYEVIHENAESVTQQAVTRFRRLAACELPQPVDRYPTSRYALLELQPLSGQRHQLRRHLKHIAHPIIGDATYGKGRHNRLFQTLFGCRRMLLASVETQLTHPVTGQALTLRAPLAADFSAVLSQLGWVGCLPPQWMA